MQTGKNNFSVSTHSIRNIFAILACVFLIATFTSCSASISYPTETGTSIIPSPTPSITNTLTLTPTPTSIPTLTPTPTPYPPALQGTPISPAQKIIALENAEQIVQLARWGKGIAHSVRYSPDGKYLAVSSTVGVYLYDADTYLLVKSFDPIPGGPGDIAFFPDGKSLAVITDSSVEIISIPAGTLLGQIEEKARNVAISDDGKRIAITICTGDRCPDTLIKIFGVDGLKLQQTIDAGDRSVDLEFSPDGKMLGVVTLNSAIIWNLENLTEFFSYRHVTISHDPYDLAFSPDGNYFAISTYSEVLLYKMKDKDLVYKLDVYGNMREMYCVEFSPDSSLLAAGSEHIYIWRVSNGRLIKALEAADPYEYPGVYTDLSWSVDGKYIVTASDFLPQQNYHSAIVWNAVTGALTKNLDGFTSQLNSLVWSPDEKLIGLASGFYEGALQVLTANDGVITQAYFFDSGMEALNFTNTIAFLPDNKSMAGGVKFDRIETRRVSGISLGDAFWVLANSPGPFSFSSDGNLIATADYSEDYSHPVIKVRRTNDLKVIQSWDMDKGTGLLGLMFDPSNQDLFVPVVQGKVLKLNIKNGSMETLAEFSSEGPLSDRLSGFAVSPDGKSFVTATWDGRIRIFHHGENPIIVSNGASSETNQDKYVATLFPIVSWSPNGELIVVSASDGTIIIVDAEHGNILCSLKGHTGDIKDLVFSPDGKLLASVSSDGTVRLWGIP